MKRLFIYAAIAAAAIGSMTSCSDFLEVEPVGKMSEPDFLNQEGVSRLITGMYATLHNDSYFEGTLTNYAYGDVMGGSANKALILPTNQTLLVWRLIHSLPITAI